MKAYERFLEYVAVWTTSDENSDTVPSAARELDLAKKLVEEMKGLGIEDARVDDKGYVYGSVPATPGCEDKAALGLIAHMDTAMDASGKDIKPQLIKNYDGGDVVLGTSGNVLSAAEFPHLAGLKGRTLITTDGTTLLGADDKAGIAEILTAVDEIIKEGLPHGKICIGFTPDEEIGRGSDHFDVEGFGADYAYTLDGDAEGEIQYENFNASTGFVTCHGVSVHTGSAKDIMVNSQTIATEFHQMLPVDEKYGEGSVEVKVTESYRNMREKIEPCMELVDMALAAIKNVGLEPVVEPIRGGTDGARLSFMGLPCPNLGTGGHAFHGVFEHITVEGMDLGVKIVKDIVRQIAE